MMDWRPAARGDQFSISRAHSIRHSINFNREYRTLTAGRNQTSEFPSLAKFSGVVESLSAPVGRGPRHRHGAASQAAGALAVSAGCSPAACATSRRKVVVGRRHRPVGCGPRLSAAAKRRRRRCGRRSALQVLGQARQFQTCFQGIFEIRATRKGKCTGSRLAISRRAFIVHNQAWAGHTLREMSILQVGLGTYTLAVMTF